MPADLTVPEGTTVVFDDAPTQDLAPYVERVTVERLSDLVEAGLVRSPEALDAMLESGRHVTARAIENLGTQRPVRRLAGTGRVDLGRFASFEHTVAEDTAATDRRAFWRVFRAIDPTLVRRIKPSDVLKLGPSIADLVKILTKDCTIEPGATLQFSGKEKFFLCGDLLIRRTGRIVVNGAGITISAASIQGEQ